MTVRVLLIGILLGAALMVCAAGAAASAGSSAADSTAAEEWEQGVEKQQGWLGRTLHRFFGRAPESGEELDGRAEEIVDSYLRYAGATVEVIIVHPVLRFDEALEDSLSASPGGFMRFASSLRSYTRESIIRQYLLFKRGDEVEPFAFADSERLLRQLEYVNDARLVVVPIDEEGETVAVVVEIRDRWPFGISGVIKDQYRYEGSFYTTNLAGVGLRFDNKILVNRNADPDVGYRGYLAKENLAGTFVTVSGEYEDSYREQRWALSAQRNLVHPAIRWVGGLGWSQVEERDNGGIPNKYVLNDYWAGHSFQVGDRRNYASGVRRSLTPAVDFVDRDYLDRPAPVTIDSNRTYHDRRQYWAGLTYQSLRDYRTSYFYRMGETEDIPAGLVAKGSIVYENGEFLKRGGAYIDALKINVHERGDASYGRLSIGGFLRNDKFEDGIVSGVVGYITPLMGRGKWQHRFFSDLRYTLGINRVGNGLIFRDRNELRGFDGRWVKGDQRLVLKLESRLFTPWSLLGFQTQAFLYGDAGLIGDEKDALFQQKIYASLGLGFRFNNPDLVLPTFELRGGVIQEAGTSSFVFAFDLGNMAYPEIRIPGAKPGTVSYR